MSIRFAFLIQITSDFYDFELLGIASRFIELVFASVNSFARFTHNTRKPQGWNPFGKGYWVKRTSFVFRRIAEISVRYRRQIDRTGAARLFCWCHKLKNHVLPGPGPMGPANGPGQSAHGSTHRFDHIRVESMGLTRIWSEYMSEYGSNMSEYVRTCLSEYSPNIVGILSNMSKKTGKDNN